VPPGLTFKKSPFCPHSVFMCFVWISEQTAIISIKWVFVKNQTVLCEVRTDPKLTSKCSPKCGPDNVTRTSEFLHNAASPHPTPNYKFRLNSQLVSSTAHSQQRTPQQAIFFFSHYFTFSLAYLYQQDERALPTKLQGSKLFSSPLIINILPLTLPLLPLSSVSLL
jgi:hypothetical protein